MERQVSRSPLAHLYTPKTYVAHDVIDEVTKAALIGTGSGLFIAALKNALSRHNVGAWSVFTRGAPLIGLCAAAPSAYVLFSRTTMNLREKEDIWATTLGGFACGATLGLPFKRFPPVFGLGAAVGLAHGLFYVFGNRLDSFKNEEDEFERKEILRRNKRRPIAETIAEVGEGRGIISPGYEERRRALIKEKYGFEVDPVKATVDGSQ
ncbi:unnamed protein product [Clonostachys solani]|uniref:NADH-ubiquinone oxidoreductase 21.3 kDa subunit n=1 Tax=Clonostachys solani TaxID=160281 RepID=A0A9N9YS28_9HYPO|nr:unnamed protein product [Clonostachys solani]